MEQKYEDKLIIETKGKKYEIPLHMVKLEFHKTWGKDADAPELLIRAICMKKEEIKTIGELISKLELGF